MAPNAFLREIERAFRENDRVGIQRIEGLGLNPADWTSIIAWSLSRLGYRGQDNLLQNSLTGLRQQAEVTANIPAATEAAQLERRGLLLLTALSDPDPARAVIALQAVGRQHLTQFLNANPELRDDILSGLQETPELLQEMVTFLNLPASFPSTLLRLGPRGGYIDLPPLADDLYPEEDRRLYRNLFVPEPLMFPPLPDFGPWPELSESELRELFGMNFDWMRD